MNTKADINDIPIKVSDLQNDSNFLTSIPSEYVTEAELNNKGYLTQHQSLDNYATKSYVSSEIANAQLSGGEVDLSGYATKDELKDAIDAIEINNPFYGKVANFLGDSQTEANQHKTKIYHDWVKEILGLTKVNNYGISGSTIANGTKGVQPMCTRYNAMDKSADLICVMGGVNDIIFDSPLGTINDNTDATFYGAMNILCQGLYSMYPGKTIIFITPTEVAATHYLNVHDEGLTVADFAKAMRIVCAKYGIKVFDANANLGVYPHIQANADYYTTDKLHLNNTANEKLGKELSNFILYGSQLLTYIDNSDNGGDNTGGDNTGGDDTGGDDTGNLANFIGKTFSYNPANSTMLYMTVSFAGTQAAGDTLDLSLTLSSVTPELANPANGSIFASDIYEVNNGEYTSAPGVTTPTLTKQDGKYIYTVRGTTTQEIAGPYVKIAFGLGSLQSLSFILESITLLKNDVDITNSIMDIGGFFAEENVTIS